MGVSVGLALTAYSIYRSEQQYQEQKNLAKGELVITKADIRNRNRLREIKAARERRQFAADVTNVQSEIDVGTTQGGGESIAGSSAAQGAKASLSAQHAERLKFSMQEERLSKAGVGDVVKVGPLKVPVDKYYAALEEGKTEGDLLQEAGLAVDATGHWSPFGGPTDVES